MTEFMKWLRVELLRLRSFDWGPGSKSTRWLKDGVAKFNSFYSISDLARKIGIPENEILGVIDSQSVKDEVEGKSFILGWNGESIVLSWLEEGISECKTDIKIDYYEKDGKFYVKNRWIQRIVYLDGSERTVSDTGEPIPATITKEAFMAALEKARQSSPRQE